MTHSKERGLTDEERDSLIFLFKMPKWQRFAIGSGLGVIVLIFIGNFNIQSKLKVTEYFKGRFSGKNSVTLSSYLKKT